MVELSGEEGLVAVSSVVALAGEVDAGIASVPDGDKVVCRALLWLLRAERDAKSLGQAGQEIVLGGLGVLLVSMFRVMKELYGSGEGWGSH